MPYIRENAAGIIVNHEKKALLAQRSDDKQFLPGAWHVPGGRIDEDENAEQALRRELREEFGIEVSNIMQLNTEFLYSHEQPTGQARTIFFLVVAKGSVHLNYENQDVRFVGPNVIGKYITDRSRGPTKTAILEAISVINNSEENLYSKILLP